MDNKVQVSLDKRKYKTIEKPTFGSVELVEYIKASDNPSESEIVSLGLCPNICVVSNSLLIKANFLETKVNIDASCCAGVIPESRNPALITMKMCQIDAED